MNKIFDEKCQYCDKKLRTNQQKRMGYCSNAHSLAHLHHKLDLLMQKLEAEEKAFADMTFTANDEFDYCNSAEFRNVANEILDLTCTHYSDKDAKFCDKCGTQLQTEV